MSDFNKIIFGIYFWPKAGNAEHRALLAREGHIITVDDARGHSWRTVYGLGRFSADVPRRARGPRARCRGAIRTLLASPRAPKESPCITASRRRCLRLLQRERSLARCIDVFAPRRSARQRDGRHRKKISDTLVWACLYQASWQEASTRLAAPAAGAREHRRQNIAKSQL